MNDLLTRVSTSENITFKALELAPGRKKGLKVSQVLLAVVAPPVAFYALFTLGVAVWRFLTCPC